MEEPSRKGHKVSLVMLDRATHYLSTFAGKEKSEEEIKWATQRFVGSEASVKHVYTDGSREFKKAFRSLGLPHDTSRPHRPQTNGVAERSVGKVKEGIDAEWSKVVVAFKKSFERAANLLFGAGHHLIGDDLRVLDRHSDRGLGGGGGAEPLAVFADFLPR